MATKVGIPTTRLRTQTAIETETLGSTVLMWLEKYRALWYENFLGWPFVNRAPVRKDDITDWITANTSKGISLHSYSIEQLAIQITGDIATNYYRINFTWANSAGAEVRTDRMRITHTWIRTHGKWQIIGGMSSPVNADGQ